MREPVAASKRTPRLPQSKDPSPAPVRAGACATGDGRVFEADTLVSTLEGPALASLLGERLAKSRAGLAAMKSSPVTVVALAWPGGPWAPKGFGALVPRGEGIRSLGVLYPSSLFTGRAPAGSVLTTSFLAGALDPVIADLPDAEVVEIATREAKLLHPGLPAAPTRHWIFKLAARDPADPALPLPDARGPRGGPEVPSRPRPDGRLARRDRDGRAHRARRDPRRRALSGPPRIESARDPQAPTASPRSPRGRRSAPPPGAPARSAPPPTSGHASTSRTRRASRRGRSRARPSPPRSRAGSPSRRPPPSRGRRAASTSSRTTSRSSWIPP